jgi:hypothetical protein
MPEPDSLNNPDLNRLLLFVYLVPIIGFFPALWTLYRRQGDRKQKAVSRLAITLALLWLGGTVAFTIGAQQSEFLNVPFLLVDSLWTSGYFFVNLGLMVRLWQGKTLSFPGLGRSGNQSGNQSKRTERKQKRN